ncbi:MAG: sulfotransferase family 2 domain-containing protein [Pseudomonadota bacterium]
MIVSHEKHFVFLHVGKAAGTSITRALSPYADPMPRDALSRALSKLGIVLSPRRVYWPIHASAHYVRQRLGPGAFDDMFTFAFVRNPWDLLLSAYEYIRATPSHHRHRQVHALGTFEAYLAYEARARRYRQAHQLCDTQGRVLVDFVGHFERLEQDFSQVCERLALDHVTLPHVNATQRAPYVERYTTQARSLVAEHWSEDIERFAYTFD